MDKQLDSHGDLATNFLRMDHALCTNISNAQVRYAHQFPEQLVEYSVFEICALNGKNTIMLDGGFGSITTIQALTGILLTAIPPSSSGSLSSFGACTSQLMRRTVVKIPQIPLDVFHVCIFNVKIHYEIRHGSMTLLYDTMVFRPESLHLPQRPLGFHRTCTMA